MSYIVEYKRLGKWVEGKIAVTRFPTSTEAGRAASCRSVNSGLTYRVLKDGKTVSTFQNGNQLTKEDSE